MVSSSHKSGHVCTVLNNLDRVLVLITGLSLLPVGQWKLKILNYIDYDYETDWHISVTW